MVETSGDSERLWIIAFGFGTLLNMCMVQTTSTWGDQNNPEFAERVGGLERRRNRYSNPRRHEHTPPEMV